MGTTRRWPRPTGQNAYFLFSLSLIMIIGPSQFHPSQAENVLDSLTDVSVGTNSYLQNSEQTTTYDPNFQTTSIFNLPISPVSKINIFTLCLITVLNFLSPNVASPDSLQNLYVHQTSHHIFPFVQFDTVMQATPPSFGLRGYTGEGPTELSRAVAIPLDKQQEFKKLHGENMTNLIQKLVSKKPIDNISSDHMV